jgi:hypothetical protein
VCQRWRPLGADDLEVNVQHHPVIARADSAALVDLRSPAPP